MPAEVLLLVLQASLAQYIDPRVVKDRRLRPTQRGAPTQECQVLAREEVAEVRRREEKLSINRMHDPALATVNSAANIDLTSDILPTRPALSDPLPILS